VYASSLSSEEKYKRLISSRHSCKSS